MNEEFEDTMVQVNVYVKRSGAVVYTQPAHRPEVPDRIARLLAVAALDSAKHAIQEDGLRRALFEELE